jgi:hypothetical protein
MQCIYRVAAEEVFRIKPPVSTTHRTYWMSVPSGHSVDATIRKLISHISEKDDRLDKLQLLGHGDFGEMTIGEKWDIETIKPMRYLKSYFVDMAFGIQLLGCGVASGKSIRSGKRLVLGSFSVSGTGYSLMRAMAQHTGVSVEAGIHVQVNDRWYDIEGPAIRVYPDGTWESFQGASLE